MHPNDGRVVSSFIVQALKNKPITLYGDGTQTRYFCSVDDLIDGFVRLMDSPDDLAVNEPGQSGRVHDDRAGRRGARTERLKLLLVHEPLPQDDPKQRQPDITFSREKLDWEPRWRCATDLQPTIAYFEALLRRVSSGCRASPPAETAISALEPSLGSVLCFLALRWCRPRLHRPQPWFPAAAACTSPGSAGLIRPLVAGDFSCPFAVSRRTEVRFPRCQLKSAYLAVQ